MVDVVKQEKEKHTWISLVLIGAQAFVAGAGLGYGAHVTLQKWVFHEQVCEPGTCVEISKIDVNYVSRATYTAAVQQLNASQTAAQSANELLASKDALITALRGQLETTAASAEVKRTICANIYADIKNLDNERKALQDRGTTASLAVFGGQSEKEKGSELNKRRLEQIQERLVKLGDSYAQCITGR